MPVVSVPGLGEVEFPEGTSNATMESAIAKALKANTPNPTGSFKQNVAAGFGKGIADIDRGARQIAPGMPTNPAMASRMTPADTQAVRQGMANVDAEVAESRRLDAPLMETGGGITGNIAANV